ncbi:MAG: SDR family oxidoreductase [Chloroflexi bacterium]|jgi:pteridine reductase|nr:SDR family oxidoreductase [Chloroflexota bacterium]MBT4074652.1 SDR family oxidoreductase [Chloroflexota bacterium]MBT4515844.1 SDR family oxidoreductase [Chloroflexota bacterium]MBT5320295.1 SDR family oxidoreductase [Chloroflexota bacterium]MBT6683051.1 SDR family oxidoreductase [Chloroflexota bacterium]
MNTQNKVALVTGAGVRVGNVIARQLAKSGARIAVHHRNSVAEAREFVAEIKDGGGDADLFQAELADRVQVEALVPAIVERFGSLDILVNSASVFRDRWLNETDDADWDENLAVNVTAPFVLSRAMAKHLDGKPGKIISLTDWKTTRPKRFAYGVSKAALGGLTKSLAAALAPSIQVNEVALGAILLPVTAAPDEDAELAQKLSSRTPLGRLGTPEEVAQVVMTLIENDYITGETIYVDGGQRLSRT